MIIDHEIIYSDQNFISNSKFRNNFKLIGSTRGSTVINQRCQANLSRKRGIYPVLTPIEKWPVTSFLPRNEISVFIEKYYFCVFR